MFTDYQINAVYSPILKICNRPYHNKITENVFHCGTCLARINSEVAFTLSIPVRFPREVQMRIRV